MLLHYKTGAERAAAGQGQRILDRLPRRNQPNRGPNKFVVGLIGNHLMPYGARNSHAILRFRRIRHLERDLARDNQYMGTNKTAGVNWHSTHYGSARMVAISIGSSWTMIQRLEIPRF